MITKARTVVEASPATSTSKAIADRFAIRLDRLTPNTHYP
jgi:hypothetical protein